MVRLDEGNGIEEIIPTKVGRIELPYEAVSIESYGYDGNKRRLPCEFEVKAGRTLLSAPTQGVYSWRVKRNIQR